MTNRNTGRILSAAFAVLAVIIVIATHSKKIGPGKSGVPALDLSLPAAKTPAVSGDMEAVRKMLGVKAPEQKTGVFFGPEAEKLYKTPENSAPVTVSTEVPKIDYAASLLAFAEEGNIPAQNLLAEAYLTGKGVKQDYEEAFKWFKKSADQGNAAAQFKLGGLYYAGSGVARDQPAALEWLRRSAEGGYPEAQAALASKYLSGQDIEKDPALGLDWLNKAAQGGHEPSQFRLAGLYYYGQGTAINMPEARKWFLKSAESGNPQAQFNAGLMLAKGEGGPQDLAGGYKWLLMVSRSAGGKLGADAKKTVSALDQVISPSLKEEAVIDAGKAVPQKKAKGRRKEAFVAQPGTN